MLWVIILATITAAVCLGCASAYYCGVRNSAAKRQQQQYPSSSRAGGRADHDDLDVELNAPQRMMTATSLAAAVTSAQQQRQLIELGMNLERQRSGQGTPVGGIEAAAGAIAPPPMLTTNAPPVATTGSQDSGVQAALQIINEVRGLAESLSPRAPAVTAGLGVRAPTTVKIEPQRVKGLPKSHSLPSPRLSRDADEDSRI